MYNHYKKILYYQQIIKDFKTQEKCNFLQINQIKVLILNH